jgi:endonuclease-3 related protein
MPAVLGSEIARLLAGRYAVGSTPRIEETGGSWEGVLSSFLEREIPAGRGARLLSGLREAGLADAAELAEADSTELDDLAKAASAKLSPATSATLRRLARWGADQDSETLDRRPTEAIREELRAIKGLGPGLVDTLLLKGLGRASAPLDRGTYRVFIRHGWIDTSAGYDEAQAVLSGLAPGDPERLAGIGQGLARVARDFCKPARPRCGDCPLESLLQPGGPIEPDS